MSVQTAIDALIDEIKNAPASEVREAMAATNARSVDPDYGDSGQRELCRHIAATLRIYIRTTGNKQS